MRYINLGVFITLTLLFFSGSGFGQGGITVVSTIEELETAVVIKAPIIELNAPQFILRENLYLDFDCIFRPHSNQSIITIDCTYSYNLFIQNANVTIGRDDPNCVFILTKGAWEGSGNIISMTKYVEALFYNCQFRNFGSYNGIKIRCGAYDLICSFNNCEASYNYFDGFNLHNTDPPLWERNNNLKQL